MSATELEEFARDCVRLAEQADTLILREKLLNLAREWMRAAIDDHDASRSTGEEAAPRKRPPHGSRATRFKLRRRGGPGTAAWAADFLQATSGR
jgi:hypothetical protein